jgi:flavin-dependent dehydrogenase
MKPSAILYDLRELNTAWRKQSFQYTKEQQVTYDRLVQLRRERVRQFYKEGRVFVGSRAAYDKELAEEAAEAAKVSAEVAASEEY